jgi:diacylglycerol kinase (ATP)
MRAAAIFGLGSSEKDLLPLKNCADVTWNTRLPTTSADADAILIFGGDGTVHRHLAELVRLQLPVLVVPCGSGNDFARALKLRSRRDASAAWQRFCSGRQNVLTIDLGTITPLPIAGEAPAPHCCFCCIAGLGLDAEVTREANQLPRWLRSRGGYALSFLPALTSFAPFPMKLSTREATGWQTRSDKATILAAFANAPTYGGGMKIAPHAKLDDRQLDICIISDIDKFKLFCLFPTVYFGRHLSIPQVQYFQAEHLKVETERPLDVYADGEFICQTPIQVSIAKSALRVITH